MDSATIKQTLVDEVAYWDSVSINAFYKNAAYNPTLGYLTVKSFENGYIAVNPTTVTYYDTVFGIEYRIAKNYNENDWACMQGLYALSLDDARGFKICQPLESSLATVNGEQWMFTAIQHPDAEFGKPWVNKIPVAGSSIIVRYAEKAVDFLRAVKQVSGTHGMGLAPAKAANLSEFWNNGTGWYWRRVDNWSVPFNDAVKNTLSDTKSSFNYLAAKGKPEVLSAITHLNDKDTYLENLWLPLTQ